MIALIDYGAGNLHSVEKAFRFLGADVRRFQNSDGLDHASAAVLPGVGAFDDCINTLEQRRLLEASRQFIKTGKPFLGICVGYQALFEGSDEFDSCAVGMKIFQGPVVRFTGKEGLKVPQIGWNQVEILRTDCPLFRGIPDRSYVYFVHSYYPKPADESIVATQTEYGEVFASAIWRDNVYGTQFHPEKSQKVGLQLLRNFLTIAEV